MSKEKLLYSFDAGFAIQFVSAKPAQFVSQIQNALGVYRYWGTKSRASPPPIVFPIGHVHRPMSNRLTTYHRVAPPKRRSNKKTVSSVFATHRPLENVMAETGIEPALPREHDPKSCASASSATRPRIPLTRSTLLRNQS